MQRAPSDAERPLSNAGLGGDASLGFDARTGWQPTKSNCICVGLFGFGCFGRIFSLDELVPAPAAQSILRRPEYPCPSRFRVEQYCVFGASVGFPAPHRHTVSDRMDLPSAGTRFAGLGRRVGCVNNPRGTQHGDNNQKTASFHMSIPFVKFDACVKPPNVRREPRAACGTSGSTAWLGGKAPQS